MHICSRQTLGVTVVPHSCNNICAETDARSSNSEKRLGHKIHPTQPLVSQIRYITPTLALGGFTFLPLSTMAIVNAISPLLRSLKDFRLSYPLKKDFSKKTTRWFISAASIGIILTMLSTAAASSYEPISVYARNFNTTSLLWYEKVLRNATSSFGLSRSRVCSGSIIQLGDGM